MSTAITTNALCDYCHQKPKFSGHPYCGKTCAAQAAANLCIQCHQKPKYNNYDYCGKKCAAQAQSRKRPLGPNANNVIQWPSSQAAPAAKGNHASRGQQPLAPQYAPQPPPPQNKPPQQNAPQSRSVAQHIHAAAAQVPRLFTSSASAPATQQPRGAFQSVPQGATFFGNTNFVPAPPTENASTALGRQQVAYANTYAAAPDPNQPPATCAIPGCNEPVHIDADGVQTSEYCSMRHREEAVASGLAPACIMCGELPQTTVDYFCSRACREESMSK